MRHSLVSCSPTIRATALTGMAETIVITNASNNKVKPLSGRARGTLTVLMPHLSQRTRGTRADKAAARGEVDLDVEPVRLRVEVGAADRPGRGQPQRQLQQSCVTHGWSSVTRPMLFEPGAVLAAVNDAARRCAVACGHP